MAISSIMGRPRGTVVNRTVPASRSRVRAPVIVIDVDHSLHLSAAIHTGRSAMSPPMYIMYLCTYIYISVCSKRSVSGSRHGWQVDAGGCTYTLLSLVYLGSLASISIDL